LTGEDKGGGVCFNHLNPSSPSSGGGQRWEVKKLTMCKLKISSKPILPISRGRIKGGGETLEIFLLKFYLLNEKEKLKLYIKTPL